MNEKPGQPASHEQQSFGDAFSHRRIVLDYQSPKDSGESEMTLVDAVQIFATLILWCGLTVLAHIPVFDAPSWRIGIAEFVPFLAVIAGTLTGALWLRHCPSQRHIAMSFFISFIIALGLFFHCLLSF